ncbi:hypothetical protein RB195_006109 [Necator americanus]|uniref:Endonuclease/exonuclease/phosphatase family protein n=1 Tax=Necator americanus TaxID=51031 RepID=A0ABR1BR01_NECAM
MKSSDDSTLGLADAADALPLLQLATLLVSAVSAVTVPAIYERSNHLPTVRNTRNVSKTEFTSRILVMEGLQKIGEHEHMSNQERLQQLQAQVIWPSIVEMEPRSFVPDFLRVAVSHQLCDNLLAHPRRKLIHEGPVELVELGRTVNRYAFLFTDMFVLSTPKKYGTEQELARDGLPVSAEPGLTHDILVSRRSVRPKACNQVTGRCKGGGLESPPANKLHMSTPGEQKFSQKLMGLEACNLLMGFKIFTQNTESCRLPKRKRTRMAICTYNASEAAIEDLMMQAKKIKYDVIGLTETRRRHLLNAVYETGENCP